MDRGVLAGRGFAERRDLPDVIGFADLAYDTNATFEVVQARLAAGSVFGDTAMFPLPKGDGKTAFRPMTVLNPYDDVLLRAYVGRCSMSVKKVTDRTGVFNGLFDHTGPGWTTLNFSKQYAARTKARRDLYDREDIGAVGVFDAKEFFQNCAHDTTEHLLVTSGAPAGAAMALTTMLGQIFPTGVGLPMGFEGSGPIANLFFGEVDRELTRRGIPFVRWTDDLDTFHRTLAEWPEVLDAVQFRLLAVGIPLNIDKTAGFEKGDAAEHRLFDPNRDSIFCEDDPVAAAEGKFEVDMMMEDFFGFTENPPAAAFKNRLRGLRRKPSAGALEFIYAHPEWLDREPRAVGDYLKVLALNTQTHGEIDRDWLMDRAVGRPPSQATAAGQMHALRAVAAYKVDKVEAKALKEFAEAQVGGGFEALGSWAVRAWSESRGWKAKPATALIREVEHAGYRRAAVMGFAGMDRAHMDKHLDPIRVAHPEVGPTVSLVTSGAPRGSHLP